MSPGMFPGMFSGMLTMLLTMLLTVGVAAAPGVRPASAQEPALPGSDATVAVSLVSIDTTVGEGVGREDFGWRLLVEQRDTEAWQRLTLTATLHAQSGNRSALRAALAGGVRPAALRTVVSEVTGPIAPGSVVRIDGSMTLGGLTFPPGIGGVHPLRLSVLADGIEVARIDTAVVRLAGAVTRPLLTALVWPITSPSARAPDGRIAPEFDVLTEPGGRLDTLTRPHTAARAGVLLVPAVHVLEDLARRARQTPTGVLPPATDWDAAGTEADRTDPAQPTPDSTSPNLPSTPPSTPPNGGQNGAPDAPDPGAVRAGLLLTRLSDAVLRAPDAPATMPYADADLSALVASGPVGRDLAAIAAREGTARARALLPRRPASVSVLQGPVDPRVLDLLGSDLLLAPFDAFDQPPLALDLPLGDPVRQISTPAGRRLPVIVADPFLREALSVSTRSSPGDPVLAANEVLVRTAMLYFEAPGRADRGLLLLPSDGFDPDPRFAELLLDGLGSSPWLRPTSAQRIAANADVPLEPIRLRPTTGASLSSRLIRSLESVRAQRDLLAAAVDRDALIAAGAPVAADGSVSVPLAGRLLEEIDDELLRAVPRAPDVDTERSLALLDGARDAIDRAFGTPRLTALDLTMTDREGRLPLAVSSTSALPLRVRVAVEAPAALSWPDGDLRILDLPAGGEQSLEFTVRSGSTGSFPVTITVTDPSGTRVLARETVAVRATALARTALGGIAIVVAALTIVGAIRQRRRGTGRRARSSTLV